MSEQYSHTLIARPKDFVPTPIQVQEFLACTVEGGYVPTPATCFGRRYGGATTSVRNPFDGKSVVIERPEALEITSLNNIVTQIADNTDYTVGVEGFGKPGRPALPIAYPEGFDDPYSVQIACRVSKVLRATSHQVDEEGGYLQLPPFGKPCEDMLTPGRFTNPFNGQTIEVSEAGCARFWIEVELGKFLLPPLPNDNLDVLNAEFVEMAKRIFGIELVQGCHWG